jgi:hypothetical protein
MPHPNNILPMNQMPMMPMMNMIPGSLPGTEAMTLEQ